MLRNIGRMRAGGGRAAKAFTSAANGNWNSAATWGDTDYPRLPGDTWSIAHSVTIQSGLSVSAGSGTINAGATWTINGAYTANGAISQVGASTISGSAGGQLNLNGQTLTNTGNGSSWTFTGTSRSAYFTIRGGRGVLQNSGFNQLVSTWNFVDCQGLGDSSIGRGQTGDVTQVVQDCYFADCGQLTLDILSTGANAGFKWNRNHVAGLWSGAGGNVAFPAITMNNQTLGTGVREFKDNTYSGIGPATIPRISAVNTVGSSVTFTGNVLGRVKMACSGTGDGWSTSGNFWFNTTEQLSSDGDLFQVSSSSFKTIDGDYFYVESAGHAFGPNGNPNAWTFKNSVLEQGMGIGGHGLNWWLDPVTNSGSGTYSNNIGLGVGFGNLLVFTTAKTPTLLRINNNTFYADNQNLGTALDYFPICFSLEQAGSVSATTLDCYNNIHYDIDQGATLQEYMVANEVGGTCTFTTLDYNNAYPNLPRYSTGVTATGIGTHDKNADPVFADKARNLAKWDQSLGGPGTAANAIAELMKRNGVGGTWNTNYTPTNAVSYVFSGFQPTGAGATALNGTGLGSANIGAR